MYKLIKLTNNKKQLRFDIQILGVFIDNFKGKIYDSDQMSELESFKGDNSTDNSQFILKNIPRNYIGKFLEIRTIFQLSGIDIKDDLIATINIDIYEDDTHIQKIIDKIIPRNGQRYHLVLLEFID